jgi:hypothetical protein
MVILALNRALAKKNLPAFIRVVDARYTWTGALSVLLERGSLGTMLICKIECNSIPHGIPHENCNSAVVALPSPVTAGASLKVIAYPREWYPEC